MLENIDLFPISRKMENRKWLSRERAKRDDYQIERSGPEKGKQENLASASSNNGFKP
jgi:hypothetical protein